MEDSDYVSMQEKIAHFSFAHENVSKTDSFLPFGCQRP